MNETSATNRRVKVRIDSNGIPSVETLEPKADFGETADRIHLRAHHTLSWEIDESERVAIEFVHPEICPFTPMSSAPRLGYEHSKTDLKPNVDVIAEWIDENRKAGTDLGDYWRLEIKYDVVVKDGGRLDPVVVIDVPKTQGQGGG